MKNNSELIVVFKSKPSTRMLLSLSRQSPLINIKYGLSNTNAMVVDIGDGNKDQAKAVLEQNPDVESVAANTSFYPLMMPNDTGIAATPVPGQPRIQWNLFNMKFAAPDRSAWDVTTGSPDTVVAVLDSGVDSSHEDLAGKLSSLVDCTGSTCQTVASMTADPGDVHSSHGTHVAGLVAAATNNGKGIAGSGFNTKIMMIKVMDANKEIKPGYIINALAWAADHDGAKVINMSLGQLEENLDAAVISQIQSAVGYAWGKGLVVVASAGNCGANNQGDETCAVLDADNNIVRYATNSKVYPAACANVLSVASLKYDNGLASYSQHNDPSNPKIGNWVSVAAPGGECSSPDDKYYCIASTWPGNLYKYDAGTSMAAPQVAGLAALLFAANPHLSNSQVKQIIETTANRSIAPGATNFGAVNALAAVDAVSSGVTITPTPTSTPASTPDTTTTPTPTSTPTPTGIAATVTPGPSVTPGPTTTPTLTLTPTLSPTPTNTPYPTTPVRLPKKPPDPYPLAPYCPVTVITGNECISDAKLTGDANCDGRIDSKDYLILRNQYDTMPGAQPVNQNANFSCKEGNSTTYFVDLVDFEIWRKHTNFD